MNSTASVQLEISFLIEEASLIVEGKVQSRGAGGKGHWEGGHYVKRGLTGGHSKYGGGRQEIVQELSDMWVCQSCGGHNQKPALPFFFEYPEGEYLRVCHECNHNGCFTLKQRIGDT